MRSSVGCILLVILRVLGAMSVELPPTRILLAGDGGQWKRYEQYHLQRIVILEWYYAFQ